MKYLTVIATGIAVIIIPAGMALADKGGNSSSNGNGDNGRGQSIFQHLQSNFEFIIGRHNNEKTNDASSTKENEDINDNNDDATSSHKQNGERRFGPFASSTKEHELHATSTHATSTNEHGNGIGKGGLPAFFQWLFGLPATTTIGDIRAEINATTSASTTNATSPQGLGFWAHFFSFFHFGGKND